MVDKAVAYLTAHPASRYGEHALAGLAILKSGAAPDHPAVKLALEAVQTANFDSTAVYPIAVALLFLMELNPAEHRPLIDKLHQQLLAMQKGHGAWGYGQSNVGDTSMHQYGMLSLWELAQRGIVTPDDHWERATNWLLRTQDPSGGFGYQAVDPGHYNLVPQTAVRNSLSAAGLGSLYIALDHFGGDAATVEAKAPDDGLPDALKPVDDPAKKARVRPPSAIDQDLLKAAFARGNSWTEKYYTMTPTQYAHYYMYAFERYQSFKDLAETGAIKLETSWYDDGVRQLSITQFREGCWEGSNGRLPDTSFAVLFLVRSSAKSIEEHKKLEALDGGILTGGSGLPANLKDIELTKGRITAKKLGGPADEMLAAMADPDDPKHAAALEALNAFSLEKDAATLTQHAAKLRELAANESPEARAAALKALARTRDLDHVPTLIYALQDDDWSVVYAAHHGLRFVSRRFSGDRVEAPTTAAQRLSAIKMWKSWFLAIRPSAEFED